MADVAANRQSGSGVASMHSHPYTCVTCAIAFRSSELQRSHMRSDWHRYNLKRRIASLPPLSSEIFAEKVLSAQASSKAAADKAAFEKSCPVCERTYYSENAFRNHLNSQKHRMKTAAVEQNQGRGDAETSSVMSSNISLGEPLEVLAPENTHDPEVDAEFSEVVSRMKESKLEDKPLSPALRRPNKPHLSREGDRSSTPTESVATETSITMTPSRCMFCNYDSSTFRLNIEHMTRFHTLFIPEKEYLTDLEGLIKYLQAKIAENHECLYCHKLKNSTAAIQTHMRDKGHTMIAFDSEEEMIEIGQFYDFRGTYSDSDPESDDDEEGEGSPSKRAGAKLGAKRAGKQANGAGSGEDEGWETDSDESSTDGEDNGADGGAGRARSKRNARSRQNAAYYSDYELFLPSGRTAGHRSLARYFRQNLRGYPSAEEKAEQQLLTEGEGAAAAEGAEAGAAEAGDENGSERRITARPRGELGMVGVTDQKKREVMAVARREEKKAQRVENRVTWNREKRANNQKHFRDDNFGTWLY